ncbi:MAG: DNA translocase FtsK [Clostridiales bacterium]|nr:DNA translocase FtsK [Clostridiales bacterium]
MSETRQSGSRKKNASAGKNTASRKTVNKNTEKKSSSGKTVTEKGNGIWDEVLLVVILVASIFLFVSNFGFGGPVGKIMSNILFGLLGLFAYVFPLVVLILVLFSLANRESLAAVVKTAGAVLGCIALSALLHMITMSRAGAEGWMEIYSYCAEHKTGGGLIGGLLSGFLHDAFGTVGAYLILLGVLIICAVIVTERSFVKGMSKGSRKVYESARQDMERRKEAAVVRKEQKREQRLERRVSGVAKDVSIPKKQETGLQEVEQIPSSERLPDPSPVQAEIPAEPDMERVFSFPVHKPEPEHYAEAEDTMPASTGGTEEIGFNEEDLLKNALSRRELEAEREHRTGREAEEEAVKEAQREAEEAAKAVLEGPEPVKEYQYPPLRLLKAPRRESGKKDISGQLQETAGHLQQILEDFGVNAVVTNASQGPAVTRFEVQPAHGVKVNKIVGLSDDIKLNLAVSDIRIEAPIPGKAAVGIEVPNKENSTVMLRELLDSGEFKKHSSKIAFAVGKDIGGNIMVTDIAKMPHLLIAGATGSGKSVCINTLIMSILYKARPDEVKLIMIDPKVVELSAYNGIPHLLIPVVTDPKKAAGALNWAVNEMMGRYNRFAELNVRNIEGYNSKIDAIAEIEDDTKPEKMPQIVIIVDELADLMMVSPGEVEDAICRLAQLARAAGIHLIIATQRPSVNVITGLIKANMPSRIAFAVSSGVDSRTILDMNGAEKLLGKGDMLFSPYGLPKPLRVQGAFVSDAEVSAVVEFLSSQSTGSSEQGERIAEQMKQIQTAVESVSIPETGGGSDRDVLFTEAGKFIIEKDKASIGMLQRWFKIGFNRAARIMDQLADAGVVGEEEGTRPRKVLMSMEEFEAYVDEYV